MNALTESTRTLLPRAHRRSYRERFPLLVTTDKQGVTDGVKSSWGYTSQPKTFRPPSAQALPRPKPHLTPLGRGLLCSSPTRLLGTLRPPQPSPSAQALPYLKAAPHPTRGRLTTLVPHRPPRHPLPTSTTSTPPYTILYIEGSPYPITEYPPYINGVDEA